MEYSKLLCVAAVICFSIPTMASLELKVNLRRRSSEGVGFNSSERLRLAVDRSKKRMNWIDAFVSGQLDAHETPVRAGNGEFVMSVAVGTPSVSFEAIVDTGSDLIWSECEPCDNCNSQSTSPIFDPSQSSSYSSLPCTDSLCDALGTSFQSGCNPDCRFRYGYGDGSQTRGDLARDTFSIGTGQFPGIAFGCVHDVEGQGFAEGVSGLVGLGRGALSLISQLGSKVDNRFSYCLVSITDSSEQTSPLVIGDTAASFTGANTISFLQNTANPSFWYIPLTGITINGNPVDIPAGAFDLQSDGSGGTIIDSGTTITYLVEAAYYPVKGAIMTAIDLIPMDGSLVGMDLCYEGSSSEASRLPTLVFNFEGGVDYEVPADNLFIWDSGLMCLAMDGTSRGFSIFGNVQQQNFHILYDNQHNTLSFMPTQCDSL